MLPRDGFEKEVKSRKIFYFICEELRTDVPHYFICIFAQPDRIINLSCCTSQFDTVRRLIERSRYPNETLVYIPASDPDNPFKKDTFVNCNEYFQYSMDEFWELYSRNKLKIIGDLPIHSFEQIMIGFKKSYIIEEEFKEALPDIDNLSS